MEFLYIKATHIIFVVTWFAGLFYGVRLNIYIVEANSKPEPERSILQNQLLIMTRRLLFGITVPSAIITLILGSWLVAYHWGNISVWLWLKFGLLVLLYAYHISLHVLYNQQKRNINKYTSDQLRIWNEVPTVLLVSIVLLAVVKDNMSLLYGFVAIIALIILLFSGIKVYKSLRNKKQ